MAAAVRSIERCDIALLVMDATEGVVEQDLKIAGLVLERGKGLILVVNKWDLLDKESHTLDHMKEEIYHQLEFARFCPIIFVSAQSGQRVPQILETALRVEASTKKRIQTADLNQVLQLATSRHQPASRAGSSNKLFYAAQVTVQPPTFIVHCANPKKIDESYRRFLVNQFRHYFGFEGTPIRIFWRARNNKKEKTA